MLITTISLPFVHFAVSFSIFTFLHPTDLHWLQYVQRAIMLTLMISDEMRLHWPPQPLHPAVAMLLHFIRWQESHEKRPTWAIRA